MPKPRKFTARMVREALKRAGRELTPEELATAVGCSVSYLLSNPVQRWPAIAVGWRVMKGTDGRGKVRGFRFQGQEPTDVWEPATPTIEELEERIRGLEVELAEARGGDHQVVTPALPGMKNDPSGA